MIDSSKVPLVEYHLEGQKNDRTIRSFIDSTDHLQFRCECDEWYKVTIVGLYKDNIRLELKCSLCNHEEHRKIYIDFIQISLEDIENLILNFDFMQWDKKETIRNLGNIRWDIKNLMERIAKENCLPVPSESEIIEQHEKIMRLLSQK